MFSQKFKTLIFAPPPFILPPPQGVATGLTVNLRKTNTPIAATIARGVSFFRDPNECKTKEIQKLHGAKNTKGVAFSEGSGLQVFTVKQQQTDEQKLKIGKLFSSLKIST